MRDPPYHNMHEPSLRLGRRAGKAMSEYSNGVRLLGGQRSNSDSSLLPSPPRICGGRSRSRAATPQDPARGWDPAGRTWPCPNREADHDPVVEGDEVATQYRRPPSDVARRLAGMLEYELDHEPKPSPGSGVPQLSAACNCTRRLPSGDTAHDRHPGTDDQRLTARRPVPDIDGLEMKTRETGAQPLDGLHEYSLSRWPARSLGSAMLLGISRRG